MFYLIIVTLAIIIALLRGGDLERLFEISIKSVYLFAIALGLRILIWVIAGLNISAIVNYIGYFSVLSYLFLLYASFTNIKIDGFKYIILGLSLNSFVILINGGKMPVLLSEKTVEQIDIETLFNNGKNAIHLIKNENTMFTFLGDIFQLPKPFPDTSILSVGDIIIIVGLFVLIQKIMINDEIPS